MMLAMSMFGAVLAGSSPDPELASPMDCAVLVAIGKAQANWGSEGAGLPFVDTGPLPDGRIYKQVCDWAGLGVSTPKIIDPAAPGPRFAVSKPVYAGQGRQATADFSYFSWEGPGSRAIFSIKTCRLKQENGTWRVEVCQQGLMN